MDRRDLLRAAMNGAALWTGLAAAREAPAAPLVLPVGPHLFLDDFLIERSERLSRVVHPPRRVEGPVLNAARFGVTQPYLTVLRDTEPGRCRMWYNRGPAVWHAESEDGLRWRDPRVAWDLPRGYGASLVDDRGRDPDPERRFKLANWQSDRARDDTPEDNGGMFVGFSPDGFRWTAHPGNPVLPTYPTGYPRIERHGVGDTVDAFWDPVRGRYGCAVKVHALPEDGYAPAPKAGRVFRRLVGITCSGDFLRWTRPERIFAPDARDEGLLEFYGMGGIHARGPLLIGLLRVLRDDLPCDPGGPVDGIGYTVLAWSRDGLRWERDREPFLDRSPERGAWDHAMAWGSGVLDSGEETLLYYGGYARGHKIAPDRERQIGVARFRRNRYVSRTAGRDEGRLRTRPFLLPGSRLALNFRATGPLQARLLRPDGAPYAGFDWSPPLAGDHLEIEPPWKHPVATLRSRPVAVEVRFREGDLFAISL